MAIDTISTLSESGLSNQSRWLSTHREYLSNSTTRLFDKGDAKQNEVRFLEGSTFAQLRKVLNEHPAIQSHTVGLSDQEILQLIGATEAAAEGLFFPDTYYFIKNSSDLEILQRAYQTMQNHLQSNWSSRAESLPLATPYEALILASLIERNRIGKWSHHDSRCFHQSVA